MGWGVIKSSRKKWTIWYSISRIIFIFTKKVYELFFISKIHWQTWIIQVLLIWSINSKSFLFSPRIKGKIDNVVVDGTSQESANIHLILSQNEDKQTLLNFNLETKPLDGECHTRVSIESRPLQIVYDAVSLWGDTVHWTVARKGYVGMGNGNVYLKFKRLYYIKLSLVKNIRFVTLLFYDK